MLLPSVRSSPVDAFLYSRHKDFKGGEGSALGKAMSSDPWYKDIVPNVSGCSVYLTDIGTAYVVLQFTKIPINQLPAGYDDGCSFQTVCINTALYLPWLTSKCLKAGVVLKRGAFGHIAEAAHVHHSSQKADLIVNCTGLSAGKLGGVEDKSMVPARGQTVLVRNEAIGVVGGSGTDDGDDEVCYIIPRAAGKVLKSDSLMHQNNDRF